ncbi:putative flavin-containing monooxygenase [Scheffersomyces coipomensis]|uniref:putative flavin-containing monooxygenase n=1 Tax=Scheffersomyces coipomensis TaxID=1788519 RepID=UPI00315CCD27
MSVITLTKDSHINPQPYRIKFKDANAVLGAKSKIPINDDLPILETESKVAIIGGGFAGIATAITCLTKLNEDDIAIFEKHDNFGGTWYANTYPGCASDIPALWYSFSFALNSNWSRIQPPQYEMEEYILEVVKQYQLRKYVHFKRSVTKLQYNEKAANWTIYMRDLTNGQLIKHTAKIVASCQGGLVNPHHFQAEGLENFEGEYMHSAIWNHDISLEGKNIAVIGNGCSANQVIPSLLKSYNPKSITQIARSKHYIMPPLPYIIQFLYQLLSFSYVGLYLIRTIVSVFNEARYPLTKYGYYSSILRFLLRNQSLYYMRITAPQKYHDMLIPNYKIGCKRIIFDYEYLPCLHDERMTLTNEPISHITKDSIVFKNNTELKVDVIVACTGYDFRRSFHTYELIGRNNVNIGDLWKKEGASAYKTVLVRDCPNFFFIGGPNASPGHSSVVTSIESSCIYFEKLASQILSYRYDSICIKTDKYNQWAKSAQEELQKAVFGTEFGGCSSWYNEDKFNSATYPYSQVHFWYVMSHPVYDDMELQKRF